MTQQTCVGYYHSQKKWKDSLEGCVDRVWFAAELEFPKILVHRLPQHTSNVNIEYAGKSEWSKQLYYLYRTCFLQHWYILNTSYSDINLFSIDDACCKLWLCSHFADRFRSEIIFLRNELSTQYAKCSGIICPHCN